MFPSAIYLNNDQKYYWPNERIFYKFCSSKKLINNYRYKSGMVMCKTLCAHAHRCTRNMCHVRVRTRKRHEIMCKIVQNSKFCCTWRHMLTAHVPCACAHMKRHTHDHHWSKSQKSSNFQRFLCFWSKIPHKKSIFGLRPQISSSILHLDLHSHHPLLYNHALNTF